MAGDWIKMRGNLWDDPRVSKLCDLIDCGEAQVVGALYWLWSMADQHTENGILPGLTLRQIDRKTGVTGFAQAMCDVGWLADHPEGVRIARFEEHNGSSAKRRSLDAQRKANVRNVSASDADEGRTEDGQETPPCGAREEKRREERKTEDNGLTPGFQRFWDTWPKSERKAARGKCFDSWRKAKADPLADAIVAHVEGLKRTPGWTKDGGQFIPAPLVYLNERRWEGADDASNDDPYGLKKAVNS